MKKIIIISLIGILIISSSYAQSKRKYTDTAVQINLRDANYVKGLNILLQDGWKVKSMISEIITSQSADTHSGVLVILTKPLKTKEDE